MKLECSRQFHQDVPVINEALPSPNYIHLTCKSVFCSEYSLLWYASRAVLSLVVLSVLGQILACILTIWTEHHIQQVVLNNAKDIIAFCKQLLKKILLICTTSIIQYIFRYLLDCSVLDRDLGQLQTAFNKVMYNQSWYEHLERDISLISLGEKIQIPEIASSSQDLNSDLDHLLEVPSQ